MFYDINIFKTYKPKIKTICIGNLNVGGTGKTPHTELIAKLLYQKNKNIAILSRGYGRKTAGFFEVTNASTAAEVGDEPLQMRHNINQDIYNYVCESRKLGIEKILDSKPNTQVILLDDAFQHRSVTCTLNILLTDANSPFYSDYFLPSGNLRDAKKSAKRADIIIVTKCNAKTDKKYIIQKISQYSNAKIIFSKIVYANSIIGLFNADEKLVSNIKNSKCIVFTGISNPTPFIEHLNKHTVIVKHFKYADHHYFSEIDLKNIIAAFKKIGENAIIITTQKDAMRVKNIPQIANFPIYYLPISIDCEFPMQML